jgi:beta-glucosidase-like glycosyl hydrolase
MGLFEREAHELEAAQLIFPGFRFGAEEWKEAERLVDLGVGGFCLFHSSASQTARFTEAMQKRAKTPLIFCADYERGVGSIVEGGTKLPAAMAFGATGDDELAYLAGRVTGREARAIGVDWVFAPVADLAGRPDNPIVNVRAYSDDPKLVTRMAEAFIKGLRDVGAAACVKHFPGHGETDVDSHLQLPVLDRSLEQLRQRELVPYLELMTEADSLMTGHLMFPQLDPKLPTSLSPATSRLAREMGFEGLIVTDALMMGAIGGGRSAKELATLCIKAGADACLMPIDPFEFHTGLVTAVEEGLILREELAGAFSRVKKLKETVGLGTGVAVREGPEVLGLPESKQLAGRVASRAMCWAGTPSTPPLGRGASVSYLELGGSTGDGPTGRPLLERLRRLGVEAKPYVTGQKGPVIASVFRYPKAYAGPIGLKPEDAEMLSRAAKDGPVTIVAFGSPYIAARINLPTLLAFSDEPVVQEAAAGVLSGREEAKGRLPIDIHGVKA